VGLRGGLDTEDREQILSPLPGIEPRSPSPEPDTILTELPGSRSFIHPIKHYHLIPHRKIIEQTNNIINKCVIFNFILIHAKYRFIIDGDEHVYKNQSA
jgi:hypothetical protein